MVVFRIWDPVEGKFCCSGRGLYAKNGRSIWMSTGAVGVALSHMPEDIKDRLIIRAYELVEVDSMGEAS
jgi:hypothetical protein